MKTIEIEINDKINFILKVGTHGIGKIESSGVHYDDPSEIEQTFDNGDDLAKYEAMVDTLENMIFACACEGVDVESDAFKKAIQTTLDAISNNS